MSEWSDFDLDFSYGAEGEQLVKELLTNGKTVEVKRDRRWIETGNIWIETSMYSIKHNDWVASGIMVTKAKYWAFVLERMIVFVTIEDLKEALRQFGRRTENKKEPNPSRGYLLRLEDIHKVQALQRSNN